MCQEVRDHAKFGSFPHVCLGCRGYVLDAHDLAELDAFLDCLPDGLIVTLQHPLVRSSELTLNMWAKCHVLLYHKLSVTPLLLTNTEVKLEDNNTCAVYSSPQVIDITYAKDRAV
jgi:hypothetical protein